MVFVYVGIHNCIWIHFRPIGSVWLSSCSGLGKTMMAWFFGLIRLAFGSTPVSCQSDRPADSVVF